MGAKAGLTIWVVYEFYSRDIFWEIIAYIRPNWIMLKKIIREDVLTKQENADAVVYIIATLCYLRVYLKFMTWALYTRDTKSHWYSILLATLIVYIFVVHKLQFFPEIAVDLRRTITPEGEPLVRVYDHPAKYSPAWDRNFKIFVDHVKSWWLFCYLLCIIKILEEKFWPRYL
jgi:hypothetical protein